VTRCHGPCCAEDHPMSPGRSHLGQPEPGRLDLHRVLGDPPQPGHPPVPRALPRPGRLATGADAGAHLHRQRHRQQHLGEEPAGPLQAHPRVVPVGALPSRPSPTHRVTAVPPPRSPDATRLPREERESWIRAKYEQRLFLAPLPAAEAPLGERLFHAVQEKDLETVLLLLAHGKKEQLNVGDKDRRTALHLACDMALVVITQLLVWVRTGRRRRGRGMGQEASGGHGVQGMVMGTKAWPWGRWHACGDCDVAVGGRGVGMRTVAWLW